MNFNTTQHDRKGDTSDVTAFVTGELSLRRITFNRSTRRAVVECTTGDSPLRLVIRGRALRSYAAFLAALLDEGILARVSRIDGAENHHRGLTYWRLMVSQAIHRGRIGQ